MGPKRTKSVRVKIGNWDELIQLPIESMRLIIENESANRQLLYQKTTRLVLQAPNNSSISIAASPNNSSVV